MNLGSLIAAAAYKELVNVDLPQRGSNQHEINGVQALREFFDTAETVKGPIWWHFFSDDAEPLRENGDFTFYDARQRHPTRTEWRLYYSGDFLTAADEGDVLVLIRTKAPSQGLHALVFRRDSAWLRSAERLFGVTNLNPANFEVFSQESLNATDLGLVGTTILEELGFGDLIPAAADDSELVLKRFDGKFPITRHMSEFAREQVGTVNPADPDATLVAWLQREEQLFRALERSVVETKVRQGFETVDEFIAFSLSVQNRRKSRMGYSLQNNLAALFDQHKIRYQSQAQTEGKNKPDFLFPGSKEYHDEKFSADLLVMLGAKSSLKERWRQILTEARRIQTKHLCTLEPGISSDQTTEMRVHSVQLVIPLAFHETYREAQRREIWSVAAFVEFVKRKQA
ncbi:MAG TPA: type II restriction endonuclease [Terriglobales bacterium]|nr:type II restriction endonuclease [Terriglobales bacterium]